MNIKEAFRVHTMAFDRRALIKMLLELQRKCETPWYIDTRVPSFTVIYMFSLRRERGMV